MQNGLSSFFSDLHVVVTDKNVRSTVQFVPGKHRIYSASALNSPYSKLLLNMCLKNATQRLIMETLFDLHSSTFSSVQYAHTMIWMHDFLCYIQICSEANEILEVRKIP